MYKNLIYLDSAIWLADPLFLLLTQLVYTCVTRPLLSMRRGGNARLTLYMVQYSGLIKFKYYWFLCLLTSGY